MMSAILHLLVMFVADIFKSRRRLQAENLFLRHQLNIALRRAPRRRRLYSSDRALLVWMTRLWPSLIGAAQVGSAGDDPSVASRGLESFLALEIPKAGRAPEPQVDDCPGGQSGDGCTGKSDSRPSAPHYLPPSTGPGAVG